MDSAHTIALPASLAWMRRFPMDGAPYYSIANRAPTSSVMVRRRLTCARWRRGSCSSALRMNATSPAQFCSRDCEARSEWTVDEAFRISPGPLPGWSSTLACQDPVRPDGHRPDLGRSATRDQPLSWTRSPACPDAICARCLSEQAENQPGRGPPPRAARRQNVKDRRWPMMAPSPAPKAPPRSAPTAPAGRAVSMAGGQRGG